MKILKILLGVVIAIVLLLVLLVVLAFAMIDSAARAGVEYGASYALGVDTTLQSADVKLFAGEFEMDGLEVSNPEGFSRPHFMVLGNGALAVSLESLQTEVVRVPSFSLSNVELALQKADGKTNYGVILDNLKRFESGEKPPPDPNKQSGKKVAIDEIVITDVKVHVDLAPAGGELTKLDVTIPEIRLTDVGQGGAKPLEVAEVVGVLTKAILEAVVQTAGDQLPAAIVGELQNGLSQLSSLGDMGIGMASDAAAQVEQIAGEAVQGVQTGVEEATKGIEDAVKGVGGLLGGDKKKDDGGSGGGG
ncbi:MAG: hypothetical protein VYC34_10060, partial [Planctomycetota bacterium]|nr:hypothetical protein [Planctomycetota bacterium]